ncbi:MULTISPECIES: head completion/stabilization protein [Pasteurellaceae]|uniref:Head completion/stabilization protein n=1 Tax=Pasteurella atlantica TaxID=2827233 RepID=A0AAW8CPB1_9PAST|nr:head completion/stabilization protein [Pasteurella atlantica]MBR0573341.1 head completion/stabilization protein [Pasteurella atlantica]MDP8040477.1 head completion/stabilization protein [Pasteurella atlantica]MDP8041868.1 head completion/stabilization protein [Pasteurella atlantica]MDP8043935.1 head completion/stabilization protein [Pasteurella atlantica]MDP8046786.1 head completion/stabilization protein [Pasteurella atlantica]
MSKVISVPFNERYQNTDSTEQQEDQVITNNKFFPDISLFNARNSMRIDGTVTNQRLLMALVEAMATVNQDLRAFRQKCQADNIATISEADDEVINGQSVLEQRYQRAVYCYAVANLYERYSSYDLTRDGENKSELLNQSVDELRRDAQYAIKDILGEIRITAELI